MIELLYGIENAHDDFLHDITAYIDPLIEDLPTPYCTTLMSRYWCATSSLHDRNFAD